MESSGGVWLRGAESSVASASMSVFHSSSAVSGGCVCGASWIRGDAGAGPEAAVGLCVITDDADAVFEDVGSASGLDSGGTGVDVCCVSLAAVGSSWCVSMPLGASSSRLRFLRRFCTRVSMVLLEEMELAFGASVVGVCGGAPKSTTRRASRAFRIEPLSRFFDVWDARSAARAA